jgi:hypothetical protein
MFAMRRLASVFIRLISGTGPLTRLLPGTTRTQEPLGVVPRSMAHMAVLEVGLPTTREQERMLAGALSMGHTDPPGVHKHGIRAQELCANPSGIKRLR